MVYVLDLLFPLKNVMLRLLKERIKMISTALAIQEATSEAVHDESVMAIASSIFQNKDSMSSEDFARALFMYSAHLSALTATLVTHVCLTENEINEMISSIEEFDEIGKDVTNDN
jgi:hypothetical protein